MAATAQVISIGGSSPSNDGADIIGASEFYLARVKIVGVSPFLFHRWSNEAVEEKAKAAKGSKAKKSDDVESYVYRDDAGHLAIPGEYLRMSLINAAKFKQDPRSPRKSAMDLFKAGVVAVTELASVGKPTWDYLDRRRVVVQRNAVTRERPALAKGYEAEFELMVNTPEYIAADMLLDVLNTAGRLVGIGDFRPTYGRFAVTGFTTGF